MGARPSKREVSGKLSLGKRSTPVPRPPATFRISAETLAGIRFCARAARALGEPSSIDRVLYGAVSHSVRRLSKRARAAGIDLDALEVAPPRGNVVPADRRAAPHIDE